MSREGTKIDRGNVDARLRRAGELRTEVEIAIQAYGAARAAGKIAPIKFREAHVRLALDRLHAMLRDEIGRME